MIGNHGRQHDCCPDSSAKSYAARAFENMSNFSLPGFKFKAESGLLLCVPPFRAMRKQVADLDSGGLSCSSGVPH